MTADVPKVSRVAGLGIVKIAQMSGRPIYPVAIATRRRGDRIALDQLMRDDMVDDDACRARIWARLFVGGEEFAGRKPICCVAW